MRGKGIISYMVIIILVAVCSSANACSSSAGGMDRYIAGARLTQKPVLEYNGVSVTPQRWYVKEAEEGGLTRPAAVEIEFLAENQSEQPVSVFHYLLYINGQHTTHALMSEARDIPPGGSKTWTIEIEEFFLQEQRIKTIDDFEIVFNLRFGEDKSAYYSEPVPVLAEKKNRDGLFPLEEQVAYEDEYLSISTSSVFREFPGAYVIPVHVRNLSADRIILLNGRITAINGKTVEEGSPLDMDGSCMLFPGKTADINSIVYIKTEDEAGQLPLEDIKNLTLQIMSGIIQRDNVTGDLGKIERRDSVDISIQIK